MHCMPPCVVFQKACLAWRFDGDLQPGQLIPRTSTGLHAVSTMTRKHCCHLRTEGSRFRAGLSFDLFFHTLSILLQFILRFHYFANFHIFYFYQALKSAACLARCLPPPNCFIKPAIAGFTRPHLTSSRCLESRQHHIWSAVVVTHIGSDHLGCFATLCDVTVAWFEASWGNNGRVLSRRPETYYCKQCAYYGMLNVWESVRLGSPTLLSLRATSRALGRVKVSSLLHWCNTSAQSGFGSIILFVALSYVKTVKLF